MDAVAVAVAELLATGGAGDAAIPARIIAAADAKVRQPRGCLPLGAAFRRKNRLAGPRDIGACAEFAVCCCVAPGTAEGMRAMRLSIHRAGSGAAAGALRRTGLRAAYLQGSWRPSSTYLLGCGPGAIARSGPAAQHARCNEEQPCCCQRRHDAAAVANLSRRVMSFDHFKAHRGSMWCHCVRLQPHSAAHARRSRCSRRVCCSCTALSSYNRLRALD